MAVRMLCTRCWRTTRPDTRIDGSDRLERLAWCVGGLPGLAYCWWRHTTRRKVCGGCGGEDLIREARAARERSPAPGPWGGLVRSDAARIWPPGLRAPRARLRRARWMVAAASLALATALAGPAFGAWALGAAGLVLGLRARPRRAPPVEAWDASGRRLPIEAL